MTYDSDRESDSDIACVDGQQDSASLRLRRSEMFSSATRDRDLAQRSVRGGLATLTGQVFRTAVQVTGVAVLARLLTPSDYGLIGMATVVVGFAQMFKDAGLSMATVQQREITEPQVSALFWLNLAASMLIGLAVLGSAPLVALFFDRSELAGITAALSLSFLVSGLSVQHEALLRRHMRFTPLAVSQVIAQVANVSVAIAAAALGFGYWSLVLGTLTSSAVSTALALYYCPWVPGRFRRGTGVRRMVRFGGDVVGFNFVNYFSRNADYILIGRFIGAEPLGLYTRAYQLFMLPISQIRTPMSDVALPALSALRDDHQRYVAYYRRFLGVLALLTVPVALYCIVEADLVIRILLGEQWLGVVPVFRLLAIAGVTQAVATTRGLVLLSMGHSRKYLHLGIANAIVTVSAFVIGLPYGIEGVALAYALSSLAFLIPSLYLFLRDTPVAPSDFYRALGRPLFFGSLASAGTLASLQLPIAESWLIHSIALLVFLGVYCGLSWLNPSVRADLRQIARSTLGRG